jgi:hypothetical protein
LEARPKNGPWQFDFHVLLLQKYDVIVRPSDLVFKKMEVWVRVLDLPLDMMNKAYGKLIGGWIGNFITIDIDNDGDAWGRVCRLWLVFALTNPLVHGVRIRETKDQVMGY